VQGGVLTEFFIFHHCRGTDTFNTIWNSLRGSINNAKLVAVSCSLDFQMHNHSKLSHWSSSQIMEEEQPNQGKGF